MYSVPTTTAIKKEGKRGEEKTRTNMKIKIKHKYNLILRKKNKMGRHTRTQHAREFIII